MSKEVAMRAVVRLVPEYLELFSEVRKVSGWSKLHAALAEFRRRLNIAGYVALYDSEARLYGCFAVALMGAEGVKEWTAEWRSLSPEAIQRELDDCAAGSFDGDWAGGLLPDTLEQQQEAIARFEALIPVEKAAAIKQAQLLWCFLIALLHNTISVMVHGEKLTSLVPKAAAGDRSAFLKAVHVDKSLLHAHPRFSALYEEAQSLRDEKFLRNVGYRLAASPTRGPIRYPGVYLMFAMLELFGWLDELRHEEILDLCDEARLDLWQNRIEDVNYLTKRYLDYRRMQQSGGLSMH